VTLFGPADGVAAVAAGIEEDLDAAVFVADDDDAVLADVVEEEVSRVGDLALVSHEEPGPGEDSLQFESVDRLIGENAARDRALVLVDHA
jgi:hypothetical protein